MESSTTILDILAIVLGFGLLFYVFAWLLFIKPIVYAVQKITGTERIAWVLLIIFGAPIGAAVFWGVRPYRKKASKAR